MNSYLRIFYTILVLIFSLTCVSALEPIDRFFSVAELQEDFIQFQTVLEEEHCCLYEYTDSVTFDSLFNHQYKIIDHQMKLSEFFQILTPVTAKVGCGHTAVWMPDYYWDQGRNRLFPLRIRLLEDCMVAAGSYNESELIPRGSIITGINGRLISEILEELRANYSADAFNPYFIDSQIERRFSLLYARRFGFPENFAITYRAPLAVQVDKIELAPTNLEAVRAVVFANFRHPPLELELLPDLSTAIMTIPSFIYYDRVPYFTAFLDSSFSVMKVQGIANLILDLRGNDGGDPWCAAPLFSYLEKESVPYFAEPYENYTILADPVPQAENHFAGNLYTLIDGRCFSTNGHFCALLKEHNIGKFVGTPAGSSYKCNAGKNTQGHLSHTGIILYFGRSTYAAAVEGMDKNQPVMPDYPVQETIDDFIKGRDVFGETALELIKKPAVNMN